MRPSSTDPRPAPGSGQPVGTGERLRVGQGPAGEIVACGEIDPGNAHLLAVALQAIPEGEAVVVDLTGVTYLGSAPVAVLHEQAGRGLRVLVRAGTAVARVLDICGLPQVAQVEWIPTRTSPPRSPTVHR